MSALDNYRNMMDQAIEMVLLFDQFGHIYFANKQAKQLLEYEETDWNDILIDHVFPKAFAYENGMVFWSSLPEDTTEQMAYRKNRTCFSVNLKILTVDGEAKKFACLATDASTVAYLEHRAQMADEKMENAQQLKSQFVATITHELRTPVNGILGNVKTLQEMEEDAKKQNLLRLMERGCNDMHSIINNILDFSKLDAGKLELDPKEFVFRDMMDYVKATHSHKIVEKGLDFFMNISPEVPERVVGDELRIGQVLNNFISNATKFTANGKITVEVMKTAQREDKIELFFMVADTGIGIAKEDQDKLFKSFSQVEASTFRKYGGTGLGLSICKQLVELMGGNVHVESEKNKGSMFSFYVWVTVPGLKSDDNELHAYQVKIPTFSFSEEEDAVNQYGTEENTAEITKKLSKLVLCIEMENWEKAEMFMEGIRQLTSEAPREVKSAALRLKMAVQKADHDKAIEAHGIFTESLHTQE